MKYILFLLVSILLISCGNSDDVNNDVMVFRYNEKEAGINTLDPIMANDMHHNWIFNMLYNGLVRLDDSLNVVPSIAKDWKVSDGGKKYTFFLRNDVYFHDHPSFPNGKGRKVTAKDFENSFDRIIEEKRALNSFVDKLDFSNLTEPGIYAKGENVLVIKLTEPFPPLLGVLSMQNYSVVPTEIIEQLGDSFRSNPVGTGPFKIMRWDEGSSLILSKNENYFEKDEEGQSLPYLDRVEVSFIKDPYAEFMNFSKGKLDFISAVEGAEKDKLIDDKGGLKEKYVDKFILDSKPFLNTEYLGFRIDGEENLFSNVYLRKAIAYAIDKRKMILFLKNGMGIPAENGFVPRGFPGYEAEKIEGYKYDIDKSFEMLSKAGYPQGKGLPELKLYTTPSYKELCEYIQFQLKQINLNVKVEVNSPVVNREKIANGEFTFFRKSWIADYPDPENYMSLFYSKNFAPDGPNYSHYSDEVYDEKYERSINQLNSSDRLQTYLEMDKMMMEEVPVIPLFYDVSFRLYHKNVSGLSNNPINLLDIIRVKKH